MRRVRLTRHASERMTQRRVAFSDVQDVLQNHHTSYTDPDGNMNYVGHVAQRRIRVVIVGNGTKDELVIKTVIAD